MLVVEAGEKAVGLSKGLKLWLETSGGRATLINHSENHTFRIDPPQGPPVVLRVHRPGYQSSATIASELAWIGALRRETDLELPRPLAGGNGELIQSLAFGSETPTRFAVLFAFEPGREPEPNSDIAPLFERLGEIAATCHKQVEGWVLPPGFTRPTWDERSILDADGLWGDWRTAPFVEGQVLATLQRLDRKLRRELMAYGKGRERFGLIHADMRLANLLVDGEKVTLIDFDDCGFGWFGYDFAAAVSFCETAPEVPAWRQAWLSGYRRLRHFGEEDEAALEAFVLLRRMALLAWIGTHAETPLAQSLVRDFAPDTARLAVPYLDKT